MINVGLLVRVEAKVGKEAAVKKFLLEALALANQEARTPVWFAIQIAPNTFGIFDAFADESARQAHLEGPIAAKLLANAEELFTRAPQIEKIEVLAAKGTA